MFRAALLTALVLRAGLALASDPRLEYRTIDTPHFRVHFPLGLEAVAYRSARLCEEAHAALVPLLQHAPTEKTEVILSDFGDSANGSATALPRLTLHLLAAPPALDGNLGDYDDWLRILVFHEYTHILHLDTVSGLPAFLNHLMGKNYAPNQNLPSFLLEGTAVWVESRISRRGRIRSPIFRGQLRARALQGRLFDIDEVTHIPLEYPGANVWYLYGGHFMDWVAKHRSPAGLARTNRAFGDELIPFAVNESAVEGLGQPFTELWRAWQADLIGRSRAELAALEAGGGLTELYPITTTGRGHWGPRFLSDGTLLSIDSDGRTRSTLYARRPPFATDVRDEEVLRLRSTRGFDVCPGDDVLVHDRVERFEGAYALTDLFVYDRRRDRVRRVTRGARLREPACAPSGTWVAATQIVTGRTRLVRVDLTTGAITPLYDPGGIDQVGFPVVAPDGGSIVFLRVTHAQRDLVALDLATGALRSLTDDTALELHPHFSPDGRWLVYASDRTGIYDLYARAWPDGPTRRLTRVVAGVVDGVVSPDGERLVLQHLSGDGYDLAMTRFDPEGGAPYPPLVDNPPPATRDTSDQPLPTRPYAPSESIWPVAWSPAFAFSSAEDTAEQLGLSVEATDAIGRHALLGDFSTAPAVESYQASLAYAYRRLPVTLLGGLSRNTRVRAGAAFFNETRHDQRENVTSASAGIALPFGRAAHAAGASLRYTYSLVEPVGNVDPIYDPLDRPPSIPATTKLAGLSLGLSYASFESYAESIATERGVGTGVSLRLRDPRLGGEVRSAEVFATFTGWWPLWWRHTLGLKINGAHGIAEDGRRIRYGLGGAPERNVLLDALDDIAFGNRFLRGYPINAIVGERFVLAKLEYRLPLFDLYRGLSMVPLFFRRLKLSIFTDWGQASDEPLEIAPSAFRRSVGAEVVSQAVVGWRLPVDVRLGYAEGFDEDGEGQLYFFVGGWF